MQITVQSNDGQITPVWVTHLSKSECAEAHRAEGETEDTLYVSGFYWCVCSPGCIPDSDFFGPFSTASAAEKAANEQLNW